MSSKRIWRVFLTLLLVAYAVLCCAKSPGFVLWGDYCRWEYGWPCAYLERTAEEPGTRWWALWDGVTRFSPQLLVWDIVVACLISIATLLAIRWHRTQAARWYQFTIRELLLLALLLSAVLGVGLHFRQEHSREQSVGESLVANGWQVSLGLEPITPTWIRRPMDQLGIPQPTWLWRITALQRDEIGSYANGTALAAHAGDNHVSTDEAIEATILQIRTLRYLRMIVISDRSLTDGGLRALLSHARNLESLIIGGGDGISETFLPTLVETSPDLRDLELDGPCLSIDAIKGLSSLRALQRLSFSRASPCDSAIQDALLALPSIKTLHTPNHWDDSGAFSARAADRGIVVIEQGYSGASTPQATTAQPVDSGDSDETVDE